MNLTEVLHDDEIKLFHDFPRKLYQNDTEFISHLDSDIESIFSNRESTSGKKENHKRWLLFQDGEVIGKIAAFYSEHLGIAGIGFFDCIDDLNAAHELFHVAENWLKSEGYTEIQAPINFGDRDKYWGLLVEGFKNPSYQENYNYPYYRRLFELNGYIREFEQTTSETSPEQVKNEKYLDLNNIGVDSGYHFEHYRKRNMMKYVSDFTEVYNKAWKERDFFSPMSVDKIKSMMVTMKPIIREDIIWFAYYKDEPVAFLINVIDVNQIFKKLNGKLNWWQIIRFAYYRYTMKITRIRGIVFGIVPEHRGKGIYMGLIARIYHVIKNDKHLKSIELSWIGDFNAKMHVLFAKVGAVKTKTHITYKKHL